MQIKITLRQIDAPGNLVCIFYDFDLRMQIAEEL